MDTLRKIWIAGLLLTASMGLQGQKISFDYLGLSDGLSQISVTAIVQDSLNRMWIGTRNGLNLYDGSRIKVFKPVRGDSTTLLGNHVLALHHHGNHLWVGTREGLTRVDIKKLRFSQFPCPEVRSLQFFGNRLLAGTSQGLMAFDNDRDTLVAGGEIFPMPADIYCLYRDSKNYLWLGTSGGLYRYGNAGDSLSQVLDKEVSAVWYDSRQRLWAGTREEGVFLLDREYRPVAQFTEQEEKHTLKSNIIRDINEDTQGNIWIGTFMGLSVVNGKDFTVETYQHTDDYPGKLVHSSIYCITRDNQGTMWVGSYFGGVGYYNPGFDIYQRYPVSGEHADGLGYRVVGKMLEDEKKNLWIATEGGGLDYLERSTGGFTHFRHQQGSGGLSQNNVRSLYMPDKNTLFIGIYHGGLNIMDIPSGTIRQFMPQPGNPKAITSDIVNSIIPFENYYLLGTHDNILKFDPAGNSFSYFLNDKNKRETIGSVIYTLFEDSFGLLWIGTENQGLCSYNIRSGEVKKYKYLPGDSGTISSNSVYAIFEDHRFRLWIGTLGGGLNQYMRDSDTFMSYTLASHRLPGDFIFGIQESRYGNLWVATNKGLSRFDIERDRFYNYVPQNGFPLKELNHGALCLTSDGYLFVGGVDGMVSFREEDILKRPDDFQVLFSSLFVNNQEIIPGDASRILENDLAFSPEIILKPRQNIFTIHYSATSYLTDHKPAYQYRLEGFEDEWVDAGSQTFVTYTNLNAGDYTLRVRALSGVENRVVDEASLAIEVLPPVYKTWYAYLFYFLAVLSLIIWLNSFYLSKVKLANQVKAERREKEQIRELNQAKLRFFTNISHEFRTPLTLIIGILEKMIEDTRSSARHYRQLLSLNNHAQRLNNLITELLDFRKMEQGYLKLKVSEHQLLPFLQEIYHSFNDYAHHHNIKYEIKPGNKPVVLWFDARQMEKVFFNLLGNAFKAVEDGHGKVVLEVNENSHTVEVLVRDNGAGMSEDKKALIFDRFYQIDRMAGKAKGHSSGIGLALSKGIVDAHGGTISVESAEGKGTTFRVSLKKGNRHFPEEMLTGDGTAGTYAAPVLLPEVEDFPAQPEQDVQVPGDAFTLLIVEDNAEMRDLLRNLFSPWYKIIEAADGNEGIEAAISHQPDLIISDVMMPNLSGTEMCARLKRNIQTSHIPVVLLTARTALEYKIEGIETGADDYITKPFSGKLLKARVKNLLRNRAALQKRYRQEPQFDIKELATNTADQKLMEKAREIVEKHLDDSTFDVDAFAREIGLGRTMLYAKIKKISGQTPNDFILTIRLKKAAHLFMTTDDMNISEVAYAVGFNSPRYFSRCFKDFYGVSPSKYAVKRGEDDSAGKENREKEQ